MKKLLIEVGRTIICVPTLLFYFLPMLALDAARGLPREGMRRREIEKAGSIEKADAKYRAK